MNPIVFSISRVNRLRRAAAKATEFPEFDAGRLPDGRAFDATDKAHALLEVFDTLWLKPGLALWACAHRDFHGGNGEIRAVPADAVPGASSERPRLDELMVPPPGAIPLMQAIDGDGSPWSFLSASILSREADEFGAWWHGCDWSVQTIVSRAPPQADDPNAPDDEWGLTGEAPAGDWTWHGPVPLTWEPTFREIGTTRQVVLHIRNPVAQEAIYRATDTYQGGSYVGSTESELLCAGPGGGCLLARGISPRCIRAAMHPHWAAVVTSADGRLSPSLNGLAIADRHPSSAGSPVPCSRVGRVP